MDLALSGEDEAFRDELRRWIAENHDAVDDAVTWHRRLVDGGWAVPSWPRRWGGREATLTQEIVYNHEMAEAGAPVPRNSIALFNIGPMLLDFGRPEQQERYLPPMVTAEEIWCQGFSEPGAGSDLAALETRAEDRGDHWAVTGQKVWTTFAHEADLCLALCRTDPTAERHQGLSALIIDMSAPGVEVRPIREITGDEGFNEIYFTDVRVGKDAVVGEVGAGWKVAMSTLTYERLGAMKLGIQLRRQLDELIGLARHVGRDRDPLTRQRIAELAVQVDLMQLLTEDALTALQRGEDPGAALPLGKLQWSELMQEIAELALSLQGPHGLLYRDARHEIPGDWGYHCLYSRMTTIGAGTTQVQKNIIAYRLLGLPRDAGDEPRPSTLGRDRSLGPERDELRATVRRFLGERAPMAWVRSMLDDPRGTTDEVWKEAATLGLTGVIVPEAHGGLGLGYADLGIVLEELGRALHPGPLTSSALTAVAVLRDVATEDEQADLLPGIADGSVVATLALHETNQGWDWRVPTCAATRRDGGWTLDGTKLFVPDGLAADLVLVVADDGAGPALFALEADDERLEATALRTIDATKKQAELRFHDAPARRLGGGEVTEALPRALDRVIAGLVAETTGAAHRALDVANEYAKVRVQFGRAIGSFQAVQHLLADTLRRVELARAGAAAALRAADRSDHEGCHRAAVMAKAYASDALYRATADMIQVLGGIGFTWEHDAHLYYKRAIHLQHTLGGSPELREEYASLLFEGDER